MPQRRYSEKIHYITNFDLNKKITKIINVEVVRLDMRLVERLRNYENQYVFIRWAMGGEYGKLIYAGDDFVEFNIIDIETMSYRETMLIYAPLILEISVGGPDIARIVAEVSSRMPVIEKDDELCHTKVSKPIKRTRKAKASKEIENDSIID